MRGRGQSRVASSYHASTLTLSLVKQGVGDGYPLCKRHAGYTFQVAHVVRQKGVLLPAKRALTGGRGGAAPEAESDGLSVDMSSTTSLAEASGDSLKHAIANTQPPG